ncbi:hypothetical protein ACSQ67_023039 [Phaseolus vulgaris]
MKRRSPPSSSFSGEPSAKKLFCDQEDPSLYGFSAVPIPLNLNSLMRLSFPVLRRLPLLRREAPAAAPAAEPQEERLRCLGALFVYFVPVIAVTEKDEGAIERDEAIWDEVMKDEEEDEKEENCVAAEDDKVMPQMIWEEELQKKRFMLRGLNIA